ncbi:transport and Golgi organization protein 6 [Harmonia axyridis]|uniref:transport and Golgi organization protein 6 n=1 Tax=Harmonia axyridis TaxID=115357 RepID=UPI001E27611F|nr:transport and Golgi organization protein 6 [Harmonia axyridis]
METNVMKTPEIVALMTRIHNENKIGAGQFSFIEEKLDTILSELNRTFEDIKQLISGDFREITAVTDLTLEWKFMCLNFYCLHLLNEEMVKNSLISVSNAKLLRSYVENMMDIGISQNIVPNLPFYKSIRKDDIGVKEKYYMLKASVSGIHHYTFCSSLGYHLRNITLSKLFVGLLQLGYCPLMKPSQNKKGSFQMTTDFYEEVINDQKYFKEVILFIKTKISTHSFLLNLSLLMKPAIPRWFIDALLPHLNYCLKQSNGIQILFSLMNHAQTSQSSLKPISVVGRLVSMSSQCDDFESHILPQIDNLIYKGDSDRELIFLFGEILKYTYNKNREKGLLILDKLFCPLKKIVRNSDCSNVDTQRLSLSLINVIRVISYVFVNSIDKLEIQLIKNYVCILFNIYIFLQQQNPLSLAEDLRSIVIGYFTVLDKFESFKLLENLVFNIQSSVYYAPKYNLKLSTVSNNILISFDEKNKKYDVLISARTIFSLFGSDSKLHNLYFAFLLSCLLEPKKYFPDASLLIAEDEGHLSTFERKLAVFELLNTLASRDTIKKSFNQNIPEELLHYFNEIFKNALESGAHNDPEHDEYQTVFTTALILQEVLELKSCNDFELIHTLKCLRNETKDVELKTLLCKILEGNEVGETITSKCDEVEENIQLVLSENIVTQGHGLIVLKKMILAKHPKAVERKQFIFTIFKERLIHRDTYIYLAAINGIASLADLGTECTNMVLNTLCEEYREFPTEEFGPNAIEMRLKIGEVLVKISTKLGDMAPHYKALLLNTFLCGTKDEDHLVRASSLSNLGEICKVLGYKLGSIVTEILLCVHDIVSSDKHEESRRAAVFVIRQLLVGLGKDMLTILSDDILVVYRTLKFLYENDKDDVLRLQCQLAIEEVNTNMKYILTPQVELNKSKKVVVL